MLLGLGKVVYTDLAKEAVIWNEEMCGEGLSHYHWKLSSHINENIQ